MIPPLQTLLSAPPVKVRLSAELGTLAEAFHDRKVTLMEIIDRLQGRAYDLLLVFLSLPFLVPVPLPGVSTPVGLVIALIGFRLACGHKPWLPQRLLRMELPPRFFTLLLKAGEKILRAFEMLLCPKWTFLADAPLLRCISGAIIFVSGMLLALPLPIPFTNGFPGWTILFLAAGLLEKDGRFIMLGHGMFVATLAFFAAITFGGHQLFDYIRHLF